MQFKKAPAFSLSSTDGKKIGLDDFPGKRVVLVFYPADWSPVCGSELTIFNEILPEIESHNAVILGISVDNVWSHSAFAKSKNLRFPLLSDFEPKGEVARLYDAYVPDAGLCGRSLFVLDEDRNIRWRFTSPLDVNPGADGVLTALEELDSLAKKGVA